MYKHAKAQGLIEYAIILALLSGVSVGVLGATGTSIRDVYCQVTAGLGQDVCQENLTDWELHKGHCTEVEGKVCCDHYGYIFSNDFEGSDYTILIENAILTKGKGYGIFFRTVRSNGTFNGYNFQYDPGYGRGEFLFRKWVNGHELPPIARAKAPRNYKWYNSPKTIRIVIEGDTFTAFIDGEQVLTASDSTFSEGGVGIRTWDASDFCTDGVTVTTP
ncbi:MAG: hypothetical protein U9O54_03955 [Chloroflexota bacterium]|nr:hypothetical protein [Chloroflexota bacterium]